ncbi:MAG: hypothetical protein AB7S99_20030 [Pseudodonghicola sp.]
MSETEAKIVRMSPAERWDMAMTSAREAYLQLQIMQGAAGGGLFAATKAYNDQAVILVEVLGTMLVEGQLDDVRDIIDVAYAGRG